MIGQEYRKILRKKFTHHNVYKRVNHSTHDLHTLNGPYSMKAHIKESIVMSHEKCNTRNRNASYEGNMLNHGPCQLG
jgi:hypothetical protein